MFFSKDSNAQHIKPKSKTVLRRNSLSRNPLGERRTSFPQDQNFFSESNRPDSFLRRVDRDFVIPELPRGQVSIFNSNRGFASN